MTFREHNPPKPTKWPEDSAQDCPSSYTDPVRVMGFHCAGPLEHEGQSHAAGRPEVVATWDDKDQDVRA